MKPEWMKNSIFKTILVGLAGGITLNFMMLLTFRLLGFGWNGGGILLDPSIQSPKLIAVWTQLEPLPLIVSNPAPIIIGLVLFGIGHAFVYQWLAPAWPPGIKKRAWRMAVLVFFLSSFLLLNMAPVRRIIAPGNKSIPMLNIARIE
jgi:hypothetical protein